MNKKLVIKVWATILVMLIAILTLYLVARYSQQKEKELDEFYDLKSFTIGHIPTSISIPKGVGPFNWSVGPLNWSIEKVIERGDTLRRKDESEFFPWAKTSADGKFVEIVIKIENPITEEQSTYTYTHILYLVDGKGRKFSRLYDVDLASTEEQPFPAQMGLTNSIVRPGIPVKFSALFETALDSNNYTLEAQIGRRRF